MYLPQNVASIANAKAVPSNVGHQQTLTAAAVEKYNNKN